MISGEYKNGLWLDNIDNTETVLNYGLGFDETDVFPFSQDGLKEIPEGKSVAL
ncbi:hypothetical protein [uncultured Clostridium sp.]|uniref:hypothetical protein n=1 Tax=uncultured Clostridium sp. TaxID=59620 RepID=UPI0028EEA792|nr:hypothetical protein [uncultured Clostridium sp.]